MKLELKDVTLICADTINHNKALESLLKSQSKVKFARTIFFTDQKPTNPIDSVEFIYIPPFRHRQDYSEWIVRDLPFYVNTEHVLVTQWDGHVMNADAWDDIYLEYDYIGAPWVRHLMYDVPGYPKLDAENMVGNGGFSLRSKDLMQEVYQIAKRDNFKSIGEAEDCYISRTLREELTSHKYAHIRFAPVPLAMGFSIENHQWSGQFGFHGKKTMEINGWIKPQ